VAAGKRRVTRLMRQAGLEGRCKKRSRTTSVADPAAETAKDLIGVYFEPCEEMDRRNVGDITPEPPGRSRCGAPHQLTSLFAACHLGYTCAATPLAISLSATEPSMPHAVRTSRVCSPGSEGGAPMEPGVTENRGAGAGWAIPNAVV
jgi:putative transposase